MTEDNKVIDEMNELEQVTPEKAPTTKTAGEVNAHKIVKNSKSARPMELTFSIGEMLELKGLSMEVTKRDGLTVTLKRKDIIA
jgi:hypothetical protein